MTNAETLAQMFDLLSVDARIRILQALKRQPSCVTELTSSLGISLPATSQHLRLLRNAGIVKTIKRGTFVYYLLEKRKIERMRKAANGLLSTE